MTTAIQTLVDNLNHYFNHPHSYANTVREPGNKHVFDACMEQLEPSLDFEQKMVLMDYRMCCSRALDAARSGNLEGSTFWLNKTEELPDFDNPVLQKIVDINIIPAKAYQFYKEGQFDLAIDMLKETIEFSGQLVEEAGVDYMVWGQMEDYINIFRVYCTLKDKAMAIQYAQAMLKAAIHGLHTPNILEDVSPSLLLKAEFDFINYSTSDILFRLLKFENMQPKDVCREVLSVLWEEEDWSKCPTMGYPQAMFVLKYWLENDVQALGKMVEELLPYLNHLNPILQFYIFEAILSVLLESDYSPTDNSLLEHIANHYTEKLKIGASILVNYSHLNFEHLQEVA